MAVGKVYGHLQTDVTEKFSTQDGLVFTIHNLYKYSITHWEKRTMFSIKVIIGLGGYDNDTDILIKRILNPSHPTLSAKSSRCSGSDSTAVNISFPKCENRD